MTGHQIVDSRSIDSEVSSLSHHDSSLNEIDRCTSKIDSSLNLYNLSKVEKCLLYLYNTLDIEDDDRCRRYNNEYNDQDSTVSNASVFANYAESENEMDNEYSVKNSSDTGKLSSEYDVKREGLYQVKTEKPSHSYIAERRKYSRTIRKRNKNSLKQKSRDKIAKKLNSWAIGSSRVKFHPFLRIFDKNGVAVSRSVKDHDLRTQRYSNTPKFNSFLLKAALKYQDPKLLANAVVCVKKSNPQTGLRADAKRSGANVVSMPEEYCAIASGNESDSLQNLGELRSKELQSHKKNALSIDLSTKAVNSKIHLLETNGRILNRPKMSTPLIFPSEGQETLGIFKNTKSEVENVTVQRTTASLEKENEVKQEVVIITETKPKAEWKILEKKADQIPVKSIETDEITSQVCSRRRCSFNFQIEENRPQVSDLNKSIEKNSEKLLISGTTGKIQRERDTVKIDATWQEARETVENEVKIYRESLGRPSCTDEMPFIRLARDLNKRKQRKDYMNDISSFETEVIHRFDEPKVESIECRSEVTKIKVETNKLDEASKQLSSGNKSITKNVRAGAIIIAPTLNLNFGKSGSSGRVDQPKNVTNFMKPPRNIQQSLRNGENLSRNCPLNYFSVEGASYSIVDLPEPYLKTHQQRLVLPKPMPQEKPNIDLYRRYSDRSVAANADSLNKSLILRSRCSTELERAKIEVYKRIFETMLIDPDFDFVRAEDQLENINAGLIIRQEKRDNGGDIFRSVENNCTINNPGVNRYDSSVNKRFHQLNDEQVVQNMNNLKRVKISPNLTRKKTVLDAPAITLRADQRDRRIFYRFENYPKSADMFRNDYSRQGLKAKTTKEILFDLKDFVNFPSSVTEKNLTDSAVELALI
ncbi:uncharacterized protein LOC124411439 [Diprion similis]|uniref:uncharacterized protein LOC124411439 n=1 Tax=Diprion similis TaxID=362088 RepID=UPI001EF84AC9|nr:uncharacterized protein LOC124411439 [Diprion similis]